MPAPPLISFRWMPCHQFSEPTPAQPTISDTDLAELLSEDGGAWSPRKGYTPIYELDFQNGASEGIGYMEVWIGAPEPISGTNTVRETFTVSGSQEKVTSASIRLARLNGNDPLEVRLGHADGSLIEQGNVSASALPLSSSSSPSYAWVTYPFSATYTLVPGQTYHLLFLGERSTLHLSSLPDSEGEFLWLPEHHVFPGRERRNRGKRLVDRLDPVGCTESSGLRICNSISPWFRNGCPGWSARFDTKSDRLERLDRVLLI